MGERAKARACVVRACEVREQVSSPSLTMIDMYSMSIERNHDAMMRRRKRSHALALTHSHQRSFHAWRGDNVARVSQPGRASAFHPRRECCGVGFSIAGVRVVWTNNTLLHKILCSARALVMRRPQCKTLQDLATKTSEGSGAITHRWFERTAGLVQAPIAFVAAG